MQQPVAFAPLIGFLERFANIRPADTAETRDSKLSTALHELSPEFGKIVPYLAWMMSIPGPSTAEIDELEPTEIRDRIFDSLLRAVRLSASIRPSVFWIDDLQWADESTREFCRRLASGDPIPGLLAVATVRTGYVPKEGSLPWSDEELATGRVVWIDLGPLSPVESRQLVKARLSTSVAPELLQSILDSTGGNPLYIEEVVRTGVRHETARQSVEPVARSGINIPEPLQPIFEQIVDRLGRDRPVAQLASLLGRDLPGNLTRVVIASILGLPEDDVLGSLTQLIDAEIVEPVFTELSPGYRFRHDLIREALVHSVGPDAPANHGRIADAIELAFPAVAKERPALLAYHWGAAGSHTKAGTYALTAGERLQDRAAHEEAIAFFDRGLDSVSRTARVEEAAGRAGLELSLRASRAVSIQTTKGYSDMGAGEDWARVYELSRQIEAADTVVPSLLGLWSFDFVRGAYERSIAVARQIVAATDADSDPDDPEAALIGLVCLAFSLYFQGQLRAGRENAESSLHLFDAVKGRPSHIHVPQDPGLAGLSLLAPVRWALGDQVGGCQAADDALALANARESKRAINLARIGQYRAWLHQMRRDPEKARDAADQALVTAREHRIGWAVVNLSIHRGLALAHLGGEGMKVGVPLVQENLRYWRAAGAESMLSYFLGQLAEAHVLAGEYSAASDLLDEAFEQSEKMGEHFHDAELLRVRGLVRVAAPSDDGVGGVNDLRRAVATAREQGAVSLEIRSAVSLLTAAAELPDRRERIEQLEQALGRLESSESGRDEAEARALIDGTVAPPFDVSAAEEKCS
jgi:predicted ATPase